MYRETEALFGWSWICLSEMSQEVIQKLSVLNTFDEIHVQYR